MHRITSFFSFFSEALPDEPPEMTLIYDDSFSEPKEESQPVPDVPFLLFSMHRDLYLTVFNHFTLRSKFRLYKTSNVVRGLIAEKFKEIVILNHIACGKCSKITYELPPTKIIGTAHRFLVSQQYKGIKIFNNKVLYPTPSNFWDFHFHLYNADHPRQKPQDLPMRGDYRADRWFLNKELIRLADIGSGDERYQFRQIVFKDHFFIPDQNGMYVKKEHGGKEHWYLGKEVYPKITGAANHNFIQLQDFFLVENNLNYQLLEQGDFSFLEQKFPFINDKKILAKEKNIVVFEFCEFEEIANSDGTRKVEYKLLIADLEKKSHKVVKFSLPIVNSPVYLFNSCLYISKKDSIFVYFLDTEDSCGYYLSRKDQNLITTEEILKLIPFLGKSILRKINESNFKENLKILVNLCIVFKKNNNLTFLSQITEYHQDLDHKMILMNDHRLEMRDYLKDEPDQKFSYDSEDSQEQTQKSKSSPSG